MLICLLAARPRVPPSRCSDLVALTQPPIQLSELSPGDVLERCEVKSSHGRKLFLGLAHFSISGAPARSFHLFYAFAARPPFEVVAAGAPFALPQPAGEVTVQFAAGLALDEAAAELLVTYGVLDCGMHATRVALGRVLEELGVG